MPKRYEEEINEILHKFDDWPPPDKRTRRPRQEPPRRDNTVTAFGGFFEHLGPQQLMALGLALILAGVVLRFGIRMGLDATIGTYATLAGFLLLLAGYVMSVLRGGSLGHRQSMWRGQVVDLRPSNRSAGYWLWRLRSTLRNRK